MPRSLRGEHTRREAAHRLRGPLNNLMLWAAVLEHRLRDAPPEVQQALAGLRSAVHEQVDLIATLLERRP